MRRSRVLLRVGALGLAAALALSPMAGASAATKAKTGVNRSSSFCKLVLSQQSVSQKFTTKIESAFSSHNLGRAISAVSAEFNYGTEYIHDALKVGHVPTKIRAALKYLLGLYGQGTTQVREATNLSAVEAVLTDFSQAPNFSSESATVSVFVANQCGSFTSTT
jgi:hypothetical protein